MLYMLASFKSFKSFLSGLMIVKKNWPNIYCHSIFEIFKNYITLSIYLHNHILEYMYEFYVITN